MSSINDKLFQLYHSHWDGFLAEASRLENAAVKSACPLMIQVDEEKYKSAALRVMYVGQETRGWSSPGAKSMTDHLERYRRFFLEENYLGSSKKSVFWRAVKDFDNFFSERFGSGNVASVWNNVAKIGLRDKRGMNEDVRNLGHQFFPVFFREVEILAPDVIVFMTGPDRDRDILRHFPNAKIGRAVEGIPRRQLAAIDFLNFSAVAIRTYHPRYFGGFNRVLADAKAVLEQKLVPIYALRCPDPVTKPSGSFDVVDL